MNKIPKGFRQLKKEGLIDKQSISIQDIKDYLTDIFKTKTKTKHNYNPFDYPKHYMWEEDGQMCSMWTLAPGISTGDGGHEMYCNALKEECKKYAESSSIRSSKRIKHVTRKGV